VNFILVTLAAEQKESNFNFPASSSLKIGINAAFYRQFRVNWSVWYRFGWNLFSSRCYS